MYSGYKLKTVFISKYLECVYFLLPGMGTYAWMGRKSVEVRVHLSLAVEELNTG